VIDVHFDAIATILSHNEADLEGSRRVIDHLESVVRRKTAGRRKVA
jgi:hypothetical protein